MVSFGTLIVIAIGCLLAGGVLGALLHRLTDTRSQHKALEERARRAEDELKRYQQDVAEHFAKTSELVNGLTQSYRDVYEHLANSALKLTTPALSRQILDSANNHLVHSELPPLNEQQVEAPRDWAPSEGQLSEEYGLSEETPARPDEPASPQSEPETGTDEPLAR